MKKRGFHSHPKSKVDQQQQAEESTPPASGKSSTNSTGKGKKPDSTRDSKKSRKSQGISEREKGVQLNKSHARPWEVTSPDNSSSSNTTAASKKNIFVDVDQASKNGFPTPDLYDNLPRELFEATSGSSLKYFFDLCAPDNLRIESQIKLIPLPDRTYYWKQTLTACFSNVYADVRNKSNKTPTSSPSPLHVYGEGLEADKAILAAYMSLLTQLHKIGYLAKFSPRESSLANIHDIKKSQYSMIHVYSYAARFDLVPSVSVSKIMKAGHQYVKCKISLPEQGISVSGVDSSFSVAEGLAANKFKRRVESLRSELGLGKLDLRDYRALNIDNVSGFLSLFSTKNPDSHFNYSTVQIKRLGDRYWKTQVLLDGKPCGAAAILRYQEDSKKLANLFAGLEVKKQHPDLFYEYIEILRQGRGIQAKPVKPLPLNINNETTIQLEDILIETADSSIPESVSLTPEELYNAFANIKGRRRLSLLTRFSSPLESDPYEDMANAASQREYIPTPLDLDNDQSSLPIYDFTQEILETIDSSPFSIVVGSTGSGKSTQLPQIILQDAADRGIGHLCNICCTQPRRIAATSLATRVAQERNESLGSVVGYRIGQERVLPRSGGSITYCTAAILGLQLEITSDSILNDFSHIIVDEVHERDQETDSILTSLKLLVQERIRSGRHAPKIILMTATLTDSKLQNYFSFTDDKGKLSPCPVVKIPGRQFPVEHKTLEDIIEDLDDSFQDPSVGSLLASKSHSRYMKLERQFTKSNHITSRKPSDMVLWQSNWELSREREDWQMSLALVATTIAHICKTTSEGAVLVFLPGWKEIKEVEKLLRDERPLDLDFNNDYKFHICLLHSMNPAGFSEAMSPGMTGCRKILLSTDIAEVSVTIPDVQYVIDSGKSRTPIYDHVRQLKKIDRDWISLSNSIQRAGRAGRVQPGSYYALFSKERLESLAFRSRKRDILGRELHRHCLRVKLRFPDMMLKDYFSETLNPPSELQIDSAIRDLHALGAMRQSEELTHFGKFLATLTVQPYLGKMILLGVLFRCLEPMVILGASITYERDLFIYPESKEDKVRAEAIRSIYAQGTRSDHIGIVFAFKELQAIRDSEGLEAAEKWAEESYLHFDVFLKLDRHIASIQNRLADVLVVDNISAPEWNIHSENVDVIKALSFAGVYPNIGFHKRGTMFTTSHGVDAIASPESVLTSTMGDSSQRSTASLNGTICCYSKLNIGMEGERGFLREVSIVSPLVAAIFGGKLELNDRPFSSNEDSPTDLSADYNNTLIMDGWLPFQVRGSNPELDAPRTFLVFKNILDRLLGNLFETLSLSGARTTYRKDDDFLQALFVDNIVRLINEDAAGISEPSTSDYHSSAPTFSPTMSPSSSIPPSPAPYIPQYEPNTILDDHQIFEEQQSMP